MEETANREFVLDLLIALFKPRQLSEEADTELRNREKVSGCAKNHHHSKDRSCNGTKKTEGETLREEAVENDDPNLSYYVPPALRRKIRKGRSDFFTRTLVEVENHIRCVSPSPSQRHFNGDRLAVFVTSTSSSMFSDPRLNDGFSNICQT